MSVNPEDEEDEDREEGEMTKGNEDVLRQLDLLQRVSPDNHLYVNMFVFKHLKVCR